MSDLTDFHDRNGDTVEKLGTTGICRKCPPIYLARDKNKTHPTMLPPSARAIQRSAARVTAVTVTTGYSDSFGLSPIQ